MEQESLARNHLREASGAIQEASGSHLGLQEAIGTSCGPKDSKSDVLGTDILGKIMYWGRKLELQSEAVSQAQDF